MIEVMYIYCAISRYIDYCDRPTNMSTEEISTLSQTVLTFAKIQSKVKCQYEIKHFTSNSSKTEEWIETI